MPSEKDGIMIILSSPSGAGKTTLVKKISEEDNYEISISHTTRQPRPNENQNEDYFFVSEAEFKRLIKNQEFLEYAKVFNNFYGSSKKKVIDILKLGKNAIFDIDWQGTKQLSRFKNLDLIKIYLITENKEELKNRLIKRNQNSKEEVTKRFESFDEDVKHWKDYDYIIINKNLDVCFKQIEHIIKSHKEKISI